MNNRWLNILSRIILMFCVIIFLLGISSSIANLADNNVFTTLLVKFSTSLNFFAASLALLVIWLTLSRMKQTQLQFEAIVENNRFNNFYKHREKFYDHFSKNKILKYVHSLTGQSIESLTSIVYNTFYYTSFQNFQPRMNVLVQKQSFMFLAKIESSDLINIEISFEDTSVVSLIN